MQSCDCGEVEFYGISSRDVLDGKAPRARIMRLDCCACTHHWLGMVGDGVNERELECPQCGEENCTPVRLKS